MWIAGRGREEAMSTQITDILMVSDETPHTATRQPDGTWLLSWLPDRALTRNQAITGMTLAETVARGIAPGGKLWPHVESWA
jgi:hypothetical protein